VIEISHLTRRFGALTAVDDASFRIEKGEVVGFLGPNGAGKTTTMRILTGYLPATSGSAVVAGHDVVRDSMGVRRAIGYLPESVPLYREHRVIEMLQFQARLHGMSRQDAKRRIPEVLERVGVLDRERTQIGNLSRGLRQRVGLAVALLPDPEVLILDEPTSGLDPLQRIEIRKLVRELADEHTVLLSSHILSEVEAIAPRVIIIHRGRIAADGSHAELEAELAPESCVRVEAVVLATGVEKARELLGKLPGVLAVEDRGQLGVHHCFDVQCETDLREDVGALAAQRGWALRELSWQRPTLEQLFTRIALGLDGDAEPGATGARRAAPAAKPAQPASPVTLSSTAPKAASLPVLGVPTVEAQPDRVLYNLNPFDGGATRNLSAPKVAGEGAAASEEPSCLDEESDEKQSTEGGHGPA
jgi:ABC-2 type transport system ATP-binding protein